MVTINIETGAKLFVALLTTMLIGAAIAVAIIYWAIVIWTFQVNPLWGLIVFVVGSVVFGGGISMSRK